MYNLQTYQTRRSFLQLCGAGGLTLALSACRMPPLVRPPSMAPNHKPATLKLSDTDLFYQTVGNGMPCVVLHGGLGLDHTYFRPWLDALGDRLQLIYVDQRGNGRSGRPALESITIEQLAADVDALRVALGVEQIVVLGHSFGGCVALEYALRYPEQASHLLLLNAFPVFDYGAEIQAGVERRNPPADVSAAIAAPPPPTDGEFAELWRTVLPLYFHQYDDELAQAAFAETIYDTATLARSQELLATFTVVDRLTEIQCPTLVLTGSDDFICSPSQSYRLAAAIPDSQVAILPDCGHFPFIEQSMAFEKEVRMWLERNA